MQELVDKFDKLPKEIRWHFIGHLQRNKVKYIASFVHLIHGVDSYKLLEEINKQAKKNNKIIHCLLQIHIAQEETKFGLDEEELNSIVNEIEVLQLNNARICGLMGMASFTSDRQKVKNEFSIIKKYFSRIPGLKILSTGMSSDYKMAIEEGSTMVRIGSLLFGERENS